MAFTSHKSVDEKKAILAKIAQDRIQLGLRKASEKHGISDKTYYNWKTKLNKTRNKSNSFVQTIVAQATQSKLICLIGSGDEIIQAILKLGVQCRPALWPQWPIEACKIT